MVGDYLGKEIEDEVNVNAKRRKVGDTYEWTIKGRRKIDGPKFNNSKRRSLSPKSLDLSLRGEGRLSFTPYVIHH